MKRIIIPADVKKHVRKEMLKRLFCWLIMTSALAVLIVLFGEKLFSRLQMAVKAVIYTALLIAPIFITKVYRIADRSWCGEITDIEIKNTVDSERGFKPTVETLYRKETVYFHINTDGNRTLRKKALEHPANENNITKYYSVGDIVLHVYGTDFLQIKNESSEKLICVVCGMVNPRENVKCAFCRHTLDIAVEG